MGNQTALSSGKNHRVCCDERFTPVLHTGVPNFHRIKRKSCRGRFSGFEENRVWREGRTRWVPKLNKKNSLQSLGPQDETGPGKLQQETVQRHCECDAPSSLGLENKKFGDHDPLWRTSPPHFWRTPIGDVAQQSWVWTESRGEGPPSCGGRKAQQRQSVCWCLGGSSQ